MLIRNAAENPTGPAVSGTISPAPHNILPSQCSAQVAFESSLDGRMEKRLPIAIVVHLARVQDQFENGAELTYTVNVSAHGARVLSNRPWQAGELVHVSSFKDRIPIRGKVAYCQKIGDNRYSVGLNFNGSRVTWSTFRAYSGT